MSGVFIHPVPPEVVLPHLFGLVRIFDRHPCLDDAMEPALSHLVSTGCFGSGIAALVSSDTPGPRVVAATEERDRPLVGVPLRMGVFPGGAALKSGSVAHSASPDGRAWIEFPILQGESVEGVFVLARGVSGDDRALSLGQWSAHLAAEALSLRARLAQSIDTALAYDRGRTHVVDPPEDAGFEGMIGNSGPMREIYSLIERVAGTDSTVLVTGESGTGKELVARAIHARSRRSRGPFVAVNCAALPESVLESELFGHEKGSFTGAHALRRGRFEMASGGTLFLDEIGDLSLAVQVKLLRILQERSFERVGGSHTIDTDVRVVVATNRNLEKEVAAGRFREDLFFRLNVFPVHTPPLRERGSDILLLADHFASRIGARTGKPILRISSPALDLFMIYHWPGNVRELENCIERAVILSTDGVIHSYNLPPSIQSAESTGTGPSTSLDGALARLEKELVVEALKMERGNAAGAARRLAVTERRMGLSLRRFGIDWRRFRTKK